MLLEEVSLPHPGKLHLHRREQGFDPARSGCWHGVAINQWKSALLLHL